MGGHQSSERARALADRLRERAEALIAVIERIEPSRWDLVPAPGVWSVGKEAEHVADAAVYHQWIVSLTIGEAVSSRRPPIERTRMTTDHSPRAVVELIRARTEDGAGLLLGLTDAQLDRPTKPPIARGERLATTIERVLIGHFDVHREAIERKRLKGA